MRTCFNLMILQQPNCQTVHSTIYTIYAMYKLQRNCSTTWLYANIHIFEEFINKQDTWIRQIEFQLVFHVFSISIVGLCHM